MELGMCVHTHAHFVCACVSHNWLVGKRRTVVVRGNYARIYTHTHTQSTGVR